MTLRDVPCQEPLDNCDGQWHVCWRCGGDGIIIADCIEDSCCCVDHEEEHGEEPCYNCDGKGGYPCPSAASHTGR